MIEISLQEFTLKIPTVNKLKVKPIDSIRLDPNYGLVQDIYYTLNRADGRAVEEGNKSVPKGIWDLVEKYVLGTIVESDIVTLNEFFELADWPLVAVLPEVTPVVPEEE